MLMLVVLLGSGRHNFCVKNFMFSENIHSRSLGPEIFNDRVSLGIWCGGRVGEGGGKNFEAATKTQSIHIYFSDFCVFYRQGGSGAELGVLFRALTSEHPII